jgi:hypothetical protein
LPILGLAQIVLRDVFLASFFLAYVEPKLFFAFTQKNSPVQPLSVMDPFGMPPPKKVPFISVELIGNVACGLPWLELKADLGGDPLQRPHRPGSGRSTSSSLMIAITPPLKGLRCFFYFIACNGEEPAALNSSLMKPSLIRKGAFW